jgi:hypothetical protein
MSGNRNRIIGAFIAGSLLFSSTGAIAASAPPVTQADPWAVLSAMSGGAAAASVCGAAAAAAAAAVQPAAGCVLPQVDVAPVPAQAAPPAPIPVPPVEPASSGFGISPLLLGLIAVAAGVALFLVLHKKHHHANSPA